MRNLLIFVLALLLFSGCSYQYKPRNNFETSSPLFATIKEGKKGYYLKHLSDIKGDIELSRLVVSDPSVIGRFCKKPDDKKCMDRVLDVIDTKYDRKALVSLYNSLVVLNSTHIQRLEALYKEVAPEYKLDKEKLSLEYRINDKSYLYEGEDLGVSTILYIGENDLRYPNEANHSKEIRALFPSSPKKFEKKARTLRRTIDHKRKVEERTYQKTIMQRSSYYPIKRADAMKAGRYTLSTDAPQTIVRGDTKTKRVVINVDGKDLDNIYPTRFTAQNGDVVIKFLSKEVSFINKTNYPIILESLTLFYNGYKSKVPLGKHFTFSKIKPKHATTTASSLFLTDNLKNAARFFNVSKYRAQNREVSFDLRLDYRVLKDKAVEKNSVKLLFHKEKRPLWDFIH